MWKHILESKFEFFSVSIMQLLRSDEIYLMVCLKCSLPEKVAAHFVLLTSPRSRLERELLLLIFSMISIILCLNYDRIFPYRTLTRDRCRIETGPQILTSNQSNLYRQLHGSEEDFYQ